MRKRIAAAICCPIIAAMSFVAPSFGADAGKVDPRYPFRTGFANANLPWYQPKVGEFPPHHSDVRISGELVSVDFYRRKGQFRASKDGQLVDFVLPPYGTAGYLNTDADLRDVPLGTDILFFLNIDRDGKFTQLATTRDQFSIDAGHGFVHYLDEIKLADGKLLTTKQKLGKKDEQNISKSEWRFTPETRIWKGAAQIKADELKVGDLLLFNMTGHRGTDPGTCSDIWVGADTHKLATETQRKKYAQFMSARGLPGWVDKTEGNNVTFTLFSGDAATFKQTYLADVAVGSDLPICVADNELRTWNPGPDKEKGVVTDIKTKPVNGYGTSGVQITVKVPFMLEGFRKGHVVRAWLSSWKPKDPPCGEGLMNYGYSHLPTWEIVELPPLEYPSQFPFRTDYGNPELPWYKLKVGEVAPKWADHVVHGELSVVDPDGKSGQFKLDGSGDLVHFTLHSESAVQCLGAESKLTDLAPGTRCRFEMFQDEKGAFTRATLVQDEFSYLAAQELVYRIERIGNGKLYTARMIPTVINYNRDTEQPPDIGRLELLVDSTTRVWKGATQIPLSQLAVGDQLRMNLTGELPGLPSRCTDIWVGPETLKSVTEAQKEKNKPAPKPAAANGRR